MHFVTMIFMPVGSRKDRDFGNLDDRHSTLQIMQGKWTCPMPSLEANQNSKEEEAHIKTQKPQLLRLNVIHDRSGHPSNYIAEDPEAAVSSSGSHAKSRYRSMWTGAPWVVTPPLHLCQHIAGFVKMHKFRHYFILKVHLQVIAFCSDHRNKCHERVTI